MTDELRGLTRDRIRESRKRHGANVLTPPARLPWHVLYAKKFTDPIIRVLVIAAAVALLVGLHEGNIIEGLGILAAILLSTGLSFLNEHRAAKEFGILNRVSDDEPIPVIREGTHTAVPKRDLVVGDVVLVEQGAEIPADGVIIKSVNLSINESSLTGESGPAPKSASAENEPGLAFPRNFAPRGCTVADGHGILRLTAVGDKTEIGKTARAAAETPSAPTPLARQLEKLAGALSVGAFAAAAVLFIAQTVRGAVMGELFVLAERGGRVVHAPLAAAQWASILCLAAAALILAAPVWAPMLRSGFAALGRPNFFPAFITKFIDKGFPRVALSAACLFAFGVIVGDWPSMSALATFLTYFMLAVTVIVVAVPEGLPMCVTLALAYAMRKMTASSNLVRKMHACETIGAASVICSDKTGTLTMNEMRVHRAVFPAVFAQSASGKNADEENPDVNAPLPEGGEAADLLAEAAAANATAHLQIDGNGRASPLGNPTEAALLLWLKACGRDYEKARNAFVLQDQITFSTERKFMATAGKSAVDGRTRAYLKGAPEIVLARCALPADAREKLLTETAAYQARGMRVIAFASKVINETDDNQNSESSLENSLTNCAWDGFFAIADPIRPDVPRAMERARAAGLRVKVVTGDNAATAREIARQAGLWNDSDTDAQHIAGENFAALDDASASEAAARIKVMSRARPLDKLRLVTLLRERGEVVAVTGDGTNDAPALNHADVGLAMGRTGTAVAKEAADIILLDDSFASIINAVAWGRSLYANIQKFVVFQLTINLAAVGIALLGPFLGVALPLTVVQMLWVNLIMDTFAALALASEPADWSLMGGAPRPAAAFIVTKPMRRTILTTGAAFLAFFLGAMALQRWLPLSPASAAGRYNLTVFFTAFVFMQFWNLWNAKVFGSTRSAFSGLRSSRGFLLMSGVIVLGQFILVECGGEMFRVVPLSAFTWVLTAVLTSPVLLIGEACRLHARSKDDPSYYRYS